MKWVVEDGVGMGIVEAETEDQALLEGRRLTDRYYVKVRPATEADAAWVDGMSGTKSKKDDQGCTCGGACGCSEGER